MRPLYESQLGISETATASIIAALGHQPASKNVEILAGEGQSCCNKFMVRA